MLHLFPFRDTEWYGGRLTEGQTELKVKPNGATPNTGLANGVESVPGLDSVVSRLGCSYCSSLAHFLLARFGMNAASVRSSQRRVP